MLNTAISQPRTLRSGRTFGGATPVAVTTGRGGRGRGRGRGALGRGRGAPPLPPTANTAATTAAAANAAAIAAAAATAAAATARTNNVAPGTNVTTTTGTGTPAAPATPAVAPPASGLSHTPAGGLLSTPGPADISNEALRRLLDSVSLLSAAAIREAQAPANGDGSIGGTVLDSSFSRVHRPDAWMTECVNYTSRTPDWQSKLLNQRHQEVTKIPKGSKIYDGDVTEGNAFLEDCKALKTKFGLGTWKGTDVPASGTGKMNDEFVLGTYPSLKRLTNFSEFVDICDPKVSRKISSVRTRSFSKWYMGGEASECTPITEVDRDLDGFLQYDPVNYNQTTQQGLLNSEKMSYRYADQLLLAALQARTTPTLWKSIMLGLSDFKFKCVNTGNIYVSGLMVLDALFTRVIATTRLKSKEWTKKFEAVSMKYHGNNFQKMVSELLYLQTMIQEVKGEEYCSDIVFLDRLFEILSAYDGCDVWEHNVIEEKTKYGRNNWGTHKMTLIADLSEIYKDCVSDKTWGNRHNAKVISLITKIEKTEASLKAAHVALTAKQSEYLDRKPAAKVTPGKKDDMWKMTKDGEVKKCPNTGVSFKWCGKGHGKGYYMPMDHNHEEWLIRKQAFKQNAARRRDSNGDSGPLKKRTMRLDDNIKSALTTRAMEENGFSAPEARHYLRDICFDEQSKE